MKIVFFSFIFFMVSSFANARPIKLYSEWTPPFTYLEDGIPKGLIIALIQELQRRVGSRSPIEFLPYDEEYKSARLEPDVAIISRTRVPNQEKLFKWVGPLMHSHWVFIKKKDSQININSLSDAKNVSKICVCDSCSRGLENVLGNLEKGEGFKNIVRSSDDIQNLDKLVEGKVDLWLTSDNRIDEVLLDSNKKFSDIEIVYFIERQSTNEIAFSLKTSDVVIRQWQKALDAMKADGTYTRIFLDHQYMPSNLMPPPW